MAEAIGGLQALSKASTSISRDGSQLHASKYSEQHTGDNTRRANLSSKAQGKLPMPPAECRNRNLEASQACCAQPAAARGAPSASCAQAPIDAAPAIPVSPESMLALKSTLSPLQRAALDQAIFFGLDLRAASVLCGRAGSGSSALPSTSSAASSFDNERRPADAGAWTDGAATVSTRSEMPSVGRCLNPAGAGRAIRMAGHVATADADETGAYPSQPAKVQDAPLRVSTRASRWLAGLLKRLLAMVGADSMLHKLVFRACALTERAATMVYDGVGALLSFAMCHAVEPLIDCAAWFAAGFAHTLQQQCAAFARTVVVLGEAAVEPIWHVLRHVQAYRTGRHLSKGAGALASLAMARVVIRAGPVVGESSTDCMSPEWPPSWKHDMTGR